MCGMFCFRHRIKSQLGNVRKTWREEKKKAERVEVKMKIEHKTRERTRRIRKGEEKATSYCERKGNKNAGM